MARWRATFGGVLMLTVAACGGGGSGGSTTSAPAGSSATAASSVATTGAPPPKVTASMSAPVSLPAGFTAVGIARSGNVQVVLGGPTGGGIVQAATRTGDSPWQVVTVGDGAGYRPPATASDNRGGFDAAAIAGGSKGFVAIGNGGFFTGNYARGSGGLIWSSRDGITWTRVDARGAVRNVDPSGLQYRSVASTSSGYVVAGFTGTRAFVLRSTDGVTWVETSEVAKTWALIPHDLIVDGDSVLFWVDEFDCQGSAFATITQPIFQLSTDGGATWAAVDATAIPTIANVVAEPDAATCGPDPSYDTIGQHYRASLGQVGLSAGAILVADSAEQHVAVSTDHTTWNPATLPAPQPVGDTAYYGPFDAPNATYAAGNMIVMLHGSGPDAKGQPKQLVGWVSTDKGATWSAIVGTALFPPPGTIVAVPSADGTSVAVLFQPTDNLGKGTGQGSVATITLK